MATYTKIDVAEAHICVGVRLFFEDAHPIPIHMLACSAREITTTLGSKLGIETVLSDYAHKSGISLADATRQAHAYAAFMKHADRDPSATLEGFSDTDNDLVLFLACHDFGRVTGGMPIEAQVYEAWWYATHVPKVNEGPLERQRRIKTCIKLFPNARSAPRREQKRIGLAVLERSLKDDSLVMAIRRTVELPRGGG